MHPFITSVYNNKPCPISNDQHERRNAKTFHKVRRLLVMVIKKVVLVVVMVVVVMILAAAVIPITIMGHERWLVVMLDRVRSSRSVRILQHRTPSFGGSRCRSNAGVAGWWRRRPVIHSPPHFVTRRHLRAHTRELALKKRLNFSSSSFDTLIFFFLFISFFPSAFLLIITTCSLSRFFFAISFCYILFVWNCLLSFQLREERHRSIHQRLC